MEEQIESYLDLTKLKEEDDAEGFKYGMPTPESCKEALNNF